MLTAKLSSIRNDDHQKIKVFKFKCPTCSAILTWTLPKDQIFTGGLSVGNICHKCFDRCIVRPTVEIEC